MYAPVDAESKLFIEQISGAEALILNELWRMED